MQNSLAVIMRKGRSLSRYAPSCMCERTVATMYALLPETMDGTLPALWQQGLKPLIVSRNCAALLHTWCRASWGPHNIRLGLSYSNGNIPGFVSLTSFVEQRDTKPCCVSRLMRLYVHSFASWRWHCNTVVLYRNTVTVPLIGCAFGGRVLLKAFVFVWTRKLRRY